MRLNKVISWICNLANAKIKLGYAKKKRTNLSDEFLPG